MYEATDGGAGEGIGGGVGSRRRGERRWRGGTGWREAVVHQVILDGLVPS